MLTLSAVVEPRLNEVRERMDELLSVLQPVGPSEEVLVQGHCSFSVAGTDAVLQEQEQYFSGLDCTDNAPTGKKQHGVFGLANPDVTPRLEQQIGTPARKKQCVFGLGNADMAPQLGEQLGFPNWYPLVGSSEGGCGPESTDVAPGEKSSACLLMLTWLYCLVRSFVCLIGTLLGVAEREDMCQRVLTWQLCHWALRQWMRLTGSLIGLFWV